MVDQAYFSDVKAWKRRLAEVGVADPTQKSRKFARILGEYQRWRVEQRRKYWKLGKMMPPDWSGAVLPPPGWVIPKDPHPETKKKTCGHRFSCHCWRHKDVRGVWTREKLMALLKKHRWNLPGICKKLGIDRATLIMKMKEYEVCMTYRLVMVVDKPKRTISTQIAGCENEDDAKRRAEKLYKVLSYKKIEQVAA